MLTLHSVTISLVFKNSSLLIMSCLAINNKDINGLLIFGGGLNLTGVLFCYLKTL